MIAAKNNKTDILKFLLANTKIDINASSNQGDTALMMAIRNNHKEAVQLLLKTNNVNIETRNFLGEDALGLCHNSSPEILNILVNYKSFESSMSTRPSSTLSSISNTFHKNISKQHSLKEIKK